MILPNQPQTAAAVAAHYNELDSFYREIWGDHVHHGYWATGRETPMQAVVALVERMADRLRLTAGQRVCDIGCGYGATAALLAERHAVDVIGVTISAAQASRPPIPARGSVTIRQQDWLTNEFPAGHFDQAYAIESSEHMPDKQRFFTEAFRTLKPGGRFAVYAWLARDNPRRWEQRYLLEPICREGRLPGMGDTADYLHLASKAGFDLIETEDISDKVRQTWGICLRRALLALATKPRYLRFLLERGHGNRIFAVTMVRIMIAYRTRSMRYCLFVFGRPEI
jgi:tocopherol O-methyltransferase